jgi:tetratricopeptide (TPR) repeat protein
MGRLARFISVASLVALTLMLIAAVGQPLFTDDTWWHLAHGKAYAQQGPNLSADPLLYAAPTPPAPAAWLADVALYGLDRMGGFTALRISHVLLVLGILGVLWSLLAKASRSLTVASTGTIVFICLATYRLIQLRPHLFTILAALLLYQWLFSRSRVPSMRQVAYTTILLGVWANVHAAFVLGPAIVGIGLAGVLIGEALKPKEERQFYSTRIRRLAAAFVLGSLATCINPAGFEPHFAYVIAGDETPSLARVGDEWSSIDLFSIPIVGAAVNPIVWILVWGLLLGCAAAAGQTIRAAYRSRSEDGFNFVELGLSALSIAAMLFAVRFVWMAVFPLLFIATSTRTRQPMANRRGSAMRIALATALVVLVAANTTIGSWPSVSRALPRSWSDYSLGFPSQKYHAHTVWFLRDAGLQGNLFAEYYMGGFLGYWLAPELKTFVNGSLNVTRDAIDSNLPIRERRGARDGETFLELLDRQNVEVFMGIRLPRQGNPTRPWFHTTAHLEGAPGWIQIFRNLSSAVYVRDTQTGRANLENVASYYQAAGLPFDAARGFEPAAVIDAHPKWAIAHGLVPTYFDKIINEVNDRSSSTRPRALNMLAEIYAALGVYDRAIAIDMERLEQIPHAVVAQRRLTWSLLRTNDWGRARLAGKRLNALAPTDALSQGIVAVATRAMTDQDRTQAVARLAVFSNAEAARLTGGMARPETRSH